MAGPELRIAQATADEVDVVLTVLNEAAQWVVDRGAEGWRPGQWRKERALEAIERGETFLARQADSVVGTLTLQWADERFWPRWPNDAGYVHRIAVGAGHHGRGIGRAMLAWAESVTHERGLAFLRLDCACGNRTLRAYYESQAFRPQGEVTFTTRWGTYCAARYEKTLRPRSIQP